MPDIDEIKNRDPDASRRLVLNMIDLEASLAAKDRQIESWKIEEQAWAETDTQRASDLAAKDECLQNLEARIETRRETIADRDAEIEKLSRGWKRDVVEFGFSLGAADALAEDSILRETKYTSCKVCGVASWDGTAIKHLPDCKLAAYTATRPQEEDQSASGPQRFTLTVTATPEQREYVEGMQKWLQDSLDNKDMIVGGPTDTATRPQENENGPETTAR